MLLFVVPQGDFLGIEDLVSPQNSLRVVYGSSLRLLL